MALLADDSAEVRCATAAQIANFTRGLLNDQHFPSSTKTASTSFADKLDGVTTSVGTPTNTSTMEGIVEGWSLFMKLQCKRG